MQPLRIALTKGRLEKSTVQLFEQAGMDCSQLREKGRKLILPVGDGSLQAVLAKRRRHHLCGARRVRHGGGGQGHHHGERQPLF